MQDPWTSLRHALLSSVVSIPECYYQVARYDPDLPEVYRERVYCYELFHQLRNRLPDWFPFTLHGEIDKSGHGYVCDLLGVDRKAGPNPDFVVHCPGHPGPKANLAVIEVKTCKCGRHSAEEALLGLQGLVTRIGYQHGILLIFGETEIDGLAVPDKGISIIWHRAVGEFPEVVDGSAEWEFDAASSIPDALLTKLQEG